MKGLKSHIRLAAMLPALACCLLAAPADALPETTLMISEVFFDPVGGDNGRQWVELYNAGATDIVLTGSYSLGFGRNDYTRTTVDLVGTILAKSTFVVGGVISDAASMNPTYDQAIDFAPNVRRGNNNGSADGLALFMLPAASIVQGSDPIHSVIYGEATASASPWLTDETGVSGSGVVNVVLPTSGISGQSIEFDGVSWSIQGIPSPSTTAIPEPGTAMLVALGLAGLSVASRKRSLQPRSRDLRLDRGPVQP